MPARQLVTEQSPSNDAESAPERPRARIIDFISSGPPLRSAPINNRPSAAADRPQVSPAPSSEFFQFVPVAQSPWLGRLPSMLANANPHSADHSSQERFGVEEATINELVEFFEQEKKCSMDPSG